MEAVPVRFKQGIAEEEEEEGKMERDENVIAHAVPVRVGHGDEHGEEEELELQHQRKLIAQAETELAEKVGQFTELLGEENWKTIEEDPVFQDVTTAEFGEKYLGNSAPLVKRIAELRVELYKLQQHHQRLLTRQGARNMTPLDLWEHLQDLRVENRALREKLERTVAGTAAEWTLETEIVSEVPVTLVCRRTVRGHRTALWSHDSNFIAVEEDNPSGCWRIWSLVDNSMHEVPLSCGKQGTPSVLWHPSEPQVAFLLKTESKQQQVQIKVWNAVEQEWMGEGYVIPGVSSAPELVGWNANQLVMREGGKLWVGPQLVSDTKDQPCSHEGGFSPCGRYHIYFKNVGTGQWGQNGTLQRFCCVYSLDARSIIYEEPMQYPNEFCPLWDSHGNLLLSCATDVGDSRTWHRHVLFSPTEQRVLREWRDMFQAIGFILPPFYNVTEEHPLWNMLDANGVAIDVLDPSLPRHTIPPGCGVFRSRFDRNGETVSPDGRRRVEQYQGHCLRVFCKSP